MLNEIRKLLRNYRRARGMTQTEVANAAGLNRLRYLRIENGTAFARRAELEAIGKVVGFDLMALLHEAGYKAFNDD